MFGRIGFAALLLLSGSAARADDGLTVVRSDYGVAETMDRFETAVKEVGLKVFKRIDHEKGAVSVDMILRPTQLLIFGSPNIGTVLMQSNQRIGIDLPLRALVWQGVGGAVWLGYAAPERLLLRYGITDSDKIQSKMTGLLEKLARRATTSLP